MTKEIPQKDFERILRQVAQEIPTQNLINISGVLEALTSYFRSEVTTRWEEEQRLKNAPPPEKRKPLKGTIDELLKYGIWSMESVDLNAVPFPKAETVSYKKGMHWGKGTVTRKLTTKTWGELAVLADELIALSGDGHHRYIEYFNPVGTDLELITGS